MGALPRRAISNGLSSWRLESRTGTAAALCGSWPDDRFLAERAVARCEVTGPALVIGSTQTLDVVDETAACRGVEVTKRPSGGGSVLLTPMGQLWMDFWLPRSDALWEDDVTRSSHWLGHAWARALEDVGVEHVSVQSMGLSARVSTRAGTSTCFGSLAAGEVAVDGAKVVGVAQRRNRAGARFFSVAYLDWDPISLLALLRFDDDERAVAARELVGAAAGLRDVLGQDGDDEVMLGSLADAVVARIADWSA